MNGRNRVRGGVRGDDLRGSTELANSGAFELAHLSGSREAIRPPLLASTLNPRPGLNEG